MKFSEAETELQRIEAALNQRYAGKRAVITSRYNGSIGAYRPPLTGKTVVIQRVFLSDFIWVFVENEQLALRHDELEVEEDDAEAVE